MNTYERNGIISHQESLILAIIAIITVLRIHCQVIAR